MPRASLGAAAGAARSWPRAAFLRTLAPCYVSTISPNATAVSYTHLLAELSRYRRGRISCAPEVADLRVSGTYHIGDTDRALAFLAQTLPVRVRYWTRYWVTVGPA